MKNLKVYLNERFGDHFTKSYHPKNKRRTSRNHKI